MKAIYSLAASLVCSLACVAQNVPPPPKPDTGPSLEVTLKFIVDKITNMGRISYIFRSKDSRNSDSQYYEQITKADSDLAGCALSFDLDKATEIGEKTERQYRESYHFSFRDIQKLEVSDSNHDATSIIFAVPDIYTLTLYTEKPVVEFKSDCVRGDCNYVKGTNSYYGGAAAHIPRVFLTFDSEDLANRVAKAMLHAVELCGGGNHDPF
jgi:hypothetical protein